MTKNIVAADTSASDERVVRAVEAMVKARDAWEAARAADARVDASREECQEVEWVKAEVIVREIAMRRTQVCVICGKPIPAERARRRPSSKTCSPEHSQRHLRNQQSRAAARWRAKTRQKSAIINK